MPTIHETIAITYETVRCSSCGVMFALDEDFIADRQTDRKTFYCPNGCARWYPGKTPEQEAKELRSQLEAARKTQQRLRDDVDHEAARARGYKGALTKAKKRIGKGVCPACNRHFANVERHIAGQHPDYADTPEHH